MKYLKQPYYVALLSAARYYAATHQKPQVFQVITKKALRSIGCGNISIQFIKCSHIESVPVREFNSPSGYIRVESPESLMLDLLRYPQHSGGINNVATVLTELAESVDHDKLLVTLTDMKVEQVVVQRLGYLLELQGIEALANIVEKFLQSKKLRTQPLVSGITTKGFQRNRRWELFINYEVESDL